MNGLLVTAKEIALEVFGTSEFKIVDVFSYGEKKIEFMVKYMANIISVSITDDLWYDFMILDDEGNEIIYSNTVHISSVSEMQKMIQQDLGKCSKN